MSEASAAQPYTGKEQDAANTPSCIRLPGPGTVTILPADQTPNGQAINGYFGGNLSASTAYHASLDPNVVGSGPVLVNPVNVGDTIDVYVVSAPIDANGVDLDNRITKSVFTFARQADGSITVGSGARGTIALASAQTAVYNRSYNSFANSGLGFTNPDLIFTSGVAIQNPGANEYAQLQLDGTYLREGGATLTVEEARDGGWLPCEDRQTLCIDCYDRQGYTVAYDEREAVTAATRALNDVAGALSFYAGPVQVPFEGFLVTLTNTTAGAVSITSFVEDVDNGAQIASSTLSIAPGTAEYFFPFPGLLVGDNNGEGYDLLWSGALADVTMDLAAPRSQAIGEIFSVNADFRPKAAWVTALADEQVKVLTLTDGTQLAYDANNAEIDISAGIPAGWTPCVEPDNDTFFVREECYEFSTPAAGPFDQTISFSTLAQPTTATIGVATHNTSGGWTIPAIADLVEQMGPNAEWRMTGMVVATSANNQGNGSVVNQTQGVSSNSVLIDPNDTNQFVFPSFQPEATDVWRWGGIVANTRNVDMQEGDPGTDNVGRADGPRLSFQLSYRVGTSGKVTVQTYEDQDGNQFFIQTDEAGVRSALASIPTEWTLCVEKEYVCDDCYTVPTVDFEFTAEPVIDTNGDMLQASGASAPVTAPLRLANAGTEPIEVQTIRVRAGANGFVALPAGNLTIGGVQYIATAYEDINGIYRTIVFTPNAAPLVLQPGTSFTSQGNWALMTGGFQGPVLTGGAQPNPPFGAGNQARAEIEYIVGTPITEEVIVRKYTDDTLATVDKDTNTVTPLASLPDDWTPCPEKVICASPVDRIVIDTSASTAGADAGSVAPGTGTINGSTGQVPEPIADIQAWIDANIDYAAPTTVVAGNDLQSPTTTGGQTDANWLEFYVVVDDPANNLLSFTSVSEGYLKVEIGECCGDYVLGNQFHNAPPGNSHTIPNPLPIGVHKIRLTNVDVGGSESIWTFDGTATNWFAASGEKPAANIVQLYVDCDGNYFEDAEATVPFVGTSFALGQYACPVSNLATEDESVEARLTALESAVPPVVPGDNPITVKAAGSVAGDGTAQEIVNATVARAAVGQYDITFANPAPTDTYPVLATMQGLPQNDDYQWAYLNRTVNGFRIEVREQDNGTAAGTLRDSGFSFQVLTLG